MDVWLSSILVIVCGIDGPDGLCSALALRSTATFLWGLFRLIGSVHLFLYWREYNVQFAYANATVFANDGLFDSSKAQS